MPLIVQTTKQKDPSFNLSTIKHHMQVATSSKTTLVETKEVMVKMYQNGTTKKLSPQAQKAAQVLAQYVYDHKASKKFEFVLGKNHQEKPLLLLSITKQQSKTRNGAPLQWNMNELANDTPGQDVLTLVRHLPWVTGALQKVEFGVLFWIHQRRLSGQEVLAGTSEVPLDLQAVNFQRVKTAQELLQDKAWVKIIQIVQGLTTQQLNIKANAQQLPSQVKIIPQHLASTIKKLITNNNDISEVAKKLMNDAHIKVQLVDETGVIRIIISKYGHDKLITIFGFKATGSPQATAQAKIDHAQDGATPPTKLKQVFHGQAPRAGDVHPPTKEGVVFTFHSATPANDQGQSSLTYIVNAEPQVEGTSTKQVIFVVGGFETRVQAHARWANLAQVAVQNLVVADFTAGIDKTQIASTGGPSKAQVISNIRNKIHDQNAKALILVGDLTITPDNATQTVTIVINNHGPTKTITIAGFEPIKNYLDQLLGAIPSSGGAFIIPEGITSRQFDAYVTAMGNVFNAKGKITMNKFAETYRARTTSLTIPDTFTTISNWFQYFNRITSLTLGSNITIIGDWAFQGCPLTSLTWGANLQTIGAYAFTSAKLASLDIPNLVTTIGRQAFILSPLTSLTLGAKLQLIGPQAFQEAKLKSLTIPDSVTTIGEMAFLESPLTIITIFDDVTLGLNAFLNAKDIIRQVRPKPTL